MGDALERDELPQALHQFVNAWNLGQTEVARSILTSNPNVFSSEYIFLLIRAGLRSSWPFELLRLLVEHDPNVTRVRCQQGHYLFYHVCFHNASNRVLELLINTCNDETLFGCMLHDAAPELARRNGYETRILIYAIDANRPLDKIRLLLEWFRPLIPTDVMVSDVIVYALECRRDSRMLRLLIETGGEPVARYRDVRGRFLLHWACLHRAPVDIINLLVGMNRDALSALDEHRETPLSKAVFGRSCYINDSCPDETIVSLVVKYPESLFIRDSEDRFPIQGVCDLPAIVKMRVEMAPQLVSINFGVGGNFSLALHKIFEEDIVPLEVVQFFLHEHRAAARVRDSSSWLPLHCALWNNNTGPEVIQCLIEAHRPAVVSAVDDGRLPIHFACFLATEPHSLATVQLLMSHYQGPEAHRNGLAVRDNKGNIPLHMACWACETQLFETLLLEFADGAHVANHDGRLPLHELCAHLPHENSRDLLHRLTQANDIFTVFHRDNNGKTPLQVAFEVGDYRRRPFPRHFVELLRDIQDEAVALLKNAFRPIAQLMNVPNDVVEIVWSFVMPPLWRPTNEDLDELN